MFRVPQISLTTAPGAKPPCFLWPARFRHPAPFLGGLVVAATA
jgi:hypothetical protein